MLIKRCCIESCKSSSTRTEDIGVTFHKFPKDDKLRQSWFIVTQKQYSNEIPAYVCSRHFCRNDFQNYQDSKYILKTDSVPSIFSWTMNDQSNVNMETDTSKGEDDLNVSSSSKDSEENIDAIQKFMEQQDKEIQEQKQNQINNPNNTQKNSDTIDHEMNDIHEEQSIAIATSVLDMILSESEVKIEPVKPIKPKHCLSAGGSVALSVGSKVEAKDYGEIWYPAEILEVDCDEMEVLVHYDSKQNKPDEWINVSSSRLRPIGSAPRAPDPAVEETFVTTEPLAAMKEEMSDDIDKTKPSFVVGERCLARWRDNRRFLATICNDLGNGTFEIVFDDGFQWKCPNSRLYKLKDSGKATDNLTVDTSVHPTTSTLSPILPGIGPSSGVAPGTNYPNPFHTHLFDPTRDYLGSKTERREMKRKLNIKEIFNIGIKKRKKPMLPKEKSVRVVRERKRKGGWRRKIKQEGAAVKTELPDAVASIIGTVERIENELANPNSIKQEKQLEKAEKGDKLEAAQIKSLKDDSEVIEGEEKVESTPESDISDIQSTDNNTTQEPASEEEVKLEKFEKPDENKHEEVIDKIKEVINKLEGGLNKVEKIESPKPEVKEEQEEVVQETVIEELPPETANEVKTDTKLEKPKKKLSKLNKSKKLRLLQEKKVKKQVEKVKSELEEMKRQFEEMRQQMLKKTEELAAQPKNQEMPESFLLPGEWCCKWVNGQPVGTVSELESEPKFDANNKLVLPRRSVQVEDKRLPEGWTKHMVRRSLGQSAGKWDVVLVGPDNRRFHTKTDMRNFLETNTDESLKAYEGPLLDFGVHLKLARRMGWFKSTGEDTPPPTGVVNSMSPLVKRKKHNNRKAERKEKKKRLKLSSMSFIDDVTDPIETLFDSTESANDVTFDNSVLEDGCVYVGSLKVQIIENLLRCPAEGCLKNFRNNTLLKMHIKHYHRELRKMLGTTPKVEDLAYARAKPTGREMKKIRKSPMSKVIKVKFPRLHRRHEDLKPKLEVQETISGVFPIDPVRPKPERLIPRSQDSPKLRQVLAANKTGKRPKVLLPVRRPEDPIEKEGVAEDFGDFEDEEIETTDIPVNLDFETAITTHTVTKPFEEAKIKGERKKSIKQLSEDDEWYGVNSDFDTRSSCPGSATPECDDRVPAGQPAVNTSEHQKDGPTYTYTESGERVKIVHMKREEIINCHCGYREEDGLMVQCELCLCWQHALCHNIQKEAEVPEKYTCSICLNPKRGRRSKRFLHDQDRLYEGLLPGAKPCELLRRSHELSGNLLRIQDALHALRVKYYVATKKNHPKLYLWAKDWENAEISMTQEKLNSDYSDLNIIINNIGKENLPVKPDDMKDLHMDMRPLAGEELSSLGSPGGTSLDLPISSTELERFTKSVHEQENPRSGVTGPQPEAAIEGGACRERLLRHLQRCQALVDARLDSIEAQVAELESQDPSFADDETADYFPRTKQTIQMLMRDLDTMEELGIVT